MTKLLVPLVYHHHTDDVCTMRVYTPRHKACDSAGHHYLSPRALELVVSLRHARGDTGA
jgi:hypothetical protein